jgi:hypothetical protein
MTRLWTRIKRFFRIGGDNEPALVRNVPPRPVLSGAVALPIPREPDDVDARGYQSNS